jgi:hypothetical protein
VNIDWRVFAHSPYLWECIRNLIAIAIWAIAIIGGFILLRRTTR